MVFTRIIVFLILLALGIAILRYTEPLVRMFGYNDLAEKYFGRGGSYTMWKLFGIILMIIGLLYLGGTLTFFPSERTQTPGLIEDVE